MARPQIRLSFWAYRVYAIAMQNITSGEAVRGEGSRRGTRMHAAARAAAGRARNENKGSIWSIVKACRWGGRVVASWLAYQASVSRRPRVGSARGRTSLPYA